MVRQIAPRRGLTKARHCDHGFLWAVPLWAEGENNKAAIQKLDIAFSRRDYFQVNTLDETSRNTGNPGTNYTIPCRYAYSSPIRTVDVRTDRCAAQSLESHKKPAANTILQSVLFHQVAEGAVGNSQHVGGLSLHAAALAQRILQQRTFDTGHVALHAYAFGKR